MEHFNTINNEQDFFEDHPMTQQRRFDFLAEPLNFTNQNEIIDFDSFNIDKLDEDMYFNSKYILEECVRSRTASLLTEADYTLHIYD